MISNSKSLFRIHYGPLIVGLSIYFDVLSSTSYLLSCSKTAYTSTPPGKGRHAVNTDIWHGMYIQ